MASSTGREACEGAVLGLGVVIVVVVVVVVVKVVEEGGISCLIESAARSGVLTGRNAAAMVGGACGG